MKIQFLKKIDTFNPIRTKVQCKSESHSYNLKIFFAALLMVWMHILCLRYIYLINSVYNAFKSPMIFYKLREKEGIIETFMKHFCIILTMHFTKLSPFISELGEKKRKLLNYIPISILFFIFS